MIYLFIAVWLSNGVPQAQVVPLKSHTECLKTTLSFLDVAEKYHEALAMDRPPILQCTAVYWNHGTNI